MFKLVVQKAFLAPPDLSSQARRLISLLNIIEELSRGIHDKMVLGGVGDSLVVHIADSIVKF